MNRTRSLPAVAVSLALAVPAVGLASGPSAAAAPLPQLAAVRTVKIDVDGDGRKDTVKITKVKKHLYKVAVTTAKKRKASLLLTSTIATDWQIEPYWGAAKLDKVKGYELLLATGGSDGYTTAVLTWRKNKLVRQAAPLDRSSTYAWYSLAIPDWGLCGYRFYSKAGKRYVEQYQLFKMGTPRWEGRLTTSVWKSTGWTKVKATKVKLTDKQAKKYTGGFQGVKIV